jgi:hypothetical protein
MRELYAIHYSIPYLLTILVAFVFFIFGLYVLSAGNAIVPLPFLKPVIFVIAAVYIFRGLGEFVVDILQATNSVLEMIYSFIALMIGLLFLIGGLKKWKE